MPHLFKITDGAGDTWIAHHRTCGNGVMYPGYNPNTGSAVPWWWFCQTCDRFVRPLSKIEAEVIDAAIAESKERLSKKRATKRGRP